MDYLRAFAVMTVLFTHSFGLIFLEKIEVHNFQTYILLLLGALQPYAVSLFITISGFVLSLNYYGSFSIRRFYLRRFQSAAVPYVVFSLIFLIVSMLYPVKVSGGETGVHSRNIIYMLLTATVDNRLWFMTLIIQLYALYPLIISIYKRFEKYGPIILSASLLIQIVYHSVYVSTATDFFELFNWLRIFPSNIFYFVLGIYCGRNLERMRSSLKAIGGTYPLLLLLLLVLTTNSLFSPLSDFTADLPKVAKIILMILQFLLTFIVLYHVSGYLATGWPMASKPIRSIGFYSFGIYLAHILYVDRIGDLMLRSIPAPLVWAVCPLTFVLTLILSYATAYLISRLPLGYLIVGRTVARS